MQGRVNGQVVLIGQIPELAVLLFTDPNSLTGQLVGNPEGYALPHQPLSYIRGQGKALGGQLS